MTSDLSGAEAVGEPLVPQPDRQPTLPALTGLRALAAFAVYLSHVGPPHASPTWLYDFFASGYMGVTLFFTLSGFVMALNYFDSLAAPTPKRVWQFAVGRISRLYPLYAAVLVYLVLYDHLDAVPLNGLWQTALAIQAWSSSASVAFGFDGPSWSIGVEFFLYACFPFLVLLTRRITKLSGLILLAIVIGAAMVIVATYFGVGSPHGVLLSAPGSAHRWLYFNPLSRLGDFMLGILAARIYLLCGDSPLVARIGGYLTILAGAALLALMAWPALYLTAWSWDTAYAIPSVLLIFGLAVAPRAPLARLLSVRKVVLLGEASFAFYLIHVPMLSILTTADGSLWTTSMSIADAAAELVNLLIIVCLAVGIHLMFERPARTFLRRILRGGGQHLGRFPQRAG